MYNSWNSSFIVITDIPTSDNEGQDQCAESARTIMQFGFKTVSISFAWL